MPPDPIEQQVRDMLERQGRFEVLQVLGKGAMGSVVLARDKKLGVKRAIKVINPRFMKSRVIRARFMAEAKVMARLERDSIVRVYDVGEFEGWMFIVMELLDGGTLAEHLKEFGAMPPRQAVEVILRVLDALDAAHTFVNEETGDPKPVIHRDVKPENILFTRRGSSKLADFGIAHIDEHTMALTAAESMMGTLGYMAPEQKTDAASADHRADIHAVAVLLWMMLNWENGVLEHPGGNDFYLTVSMPGRMDKVPDGLKSLILMATAEDPSARYQSAQEMALELRSVLRHLPESPQDTPALGSVREARLRRAALQSVPDADSDPHPGTIVPPEVGATRAQPGYSVSSGGVQSHVSSVPELASQFPQGPASHTWDGVGDDAHIGGGDTERGGTILPFGTVHESPRPMSGTQLDDMEDEILRGTKRKALLVMGTLATLAIAFVGVFLWLNYDPTPSRSLADFDQPSEVTPETIDPEEGPVVDLSLTPEPQIDEDAVAAVIPEPVLKETTPTPVPVRTEVHETVTPPKRVEPAVVEALPEPAAPTTALVKLVLGSPDDGVVLHLSGEGGSFQLSSESSTANMPLGNYRVSADFDRAGATLGTPVGTLTVDPGLVTVTCRSQMSLCRGKTLRR